MTNEASGRDEAQAPEELETLLEIEVAARLLPDGEQLNTFLDQWSRSEVLGIWDGRKFVLRWYIELVYHDDTGNQDPDFPLEIYPALFLDVLSEIGEEGFCPALDEADRARLPPIVSAVFDEMYEILSEWGEQRDNDWYPNSLEAVGHDSPLDSDFEGADGS